jgi:regulator of sigma E protease
MDDADDCRTKFALRDSFSPDHDESSATISLNLAVLNILPFPALDGGRLIVVWGEAITQRKFSPTVVGIIHTAGFLLLITLMVVLTIGDIRNAL